MNKNTIHRSMPGPVARFGRFAETLVIFSDPIKYMDKYFKEFGKLFAVPSASMLTPPAPGYPGTVFICGSDLIREVSNDREGFHRAALSHRLYPASGASSRTQPLLRIMTGLGAQRGEIHRVHRGLILPAFHKQRVKYYLGDMVAETERMMDELNAGETYDMSKVLSRLILRISTRSLFGQTEQAEGERIGLLIDQWVDFVMSVSHLFPIDIPGVPYHKWLNLSHEIETATRNMISEKRLSDADDGSLLSMLIKATDDEGSSLSEDDLIGHISLMLWGSRDATVAALSWTFLLLSLHGDAHEKVVHEAESVLSGALPTVEQLSQMPMTEHALKESLRILPPFPIINRVASMDQGLGGYEIPERAELMMSVYHTHRMPEIYSQPDAFLPERWESIDPKIFEYMPFGGGPRMCPGTNFAWQTLMIVTALMLQRYRFELVDNAKVDRIVKLGMFPKQGLPMKIHVQDYEFSKSVKRVRGNLNQMVSTLPK